jgi:hypothetical protein
MLIHVKKLQLECCELFQWGIISPATVLCFNNQVKTSSELPGVGFLGIRWFLGHDIPITQQGCFHTEHRQIGPSLGKPHYSMEINAKHWGRGEGCNKQNCHTDGLRRVFLMYIKGK